MPKARNMMQRVQQVADYLQCKYPVRRNVIILWTDEKLKDETGADLSAMAYLAEEGFYQIVFSRPNNRTKGEAVETLLHEWAHLLRIGGLRDISHDNEFACLYFMLYRDYYEMGGLEESRNFHWREE